MHLATACKSILRIKHLIIRKQHYLLDQMLNIHLLICSSKNSAAAATNYSVLRHEITMFFTENFVVELVWQVVKFLIS